MPKINNIPQLMLAATSDSMIDRVDAMQNYSTLVQAIAHKDFNTIESEIVSLKWPRLDHKFRCRMMITWMAQASQWRIIVEEIYGTALDTSSS